MDNKKVLTIGNHPSVKGGITSVINQILEYDWNSRGIDMSFIPTYIESGSLKKIMYFAFAYIRILLFLIAKRPDVVHIHMSYKGSFYRKNTLYKLCKRFHAKVIIHLHGSEFEKWYDSCGEDQKEKIRNLLKGCDAFIVLGERWERTILNIEPETNTVLVNNTVHVPEEESSWNGDSIQILFLGVLIERKGVADLLEAVRNMKEENSISKMKFLIAGSGKEEDNLKKLCQKYEIEDFVEFLGWIDNKAKKELLKNSQVMVLPSYNEGLPMAILEAISYGTPVIATDVGDISSAVVHGENGYLIKPGDVTALKNAILSVVSDEEKYALMHDRSREIAQTKFSEEDFFAKLEESYRK